MSRGCQVSPSRRRARSSHMRQVARAPVRPKAVWGFSLYPPERAAKDQAALLARLCIAGAAVEGSRARAVLHDKLAVIDGRWVVTGSSNRTASAERRNRENVLIFDRPALASNYEAEPEHISSTRPRSYTRTTRVPASQSARPRRSRVTSTPKERSPRVSVAGTPARHRISARA